MKVSIIAFNNLNRSPYINVYADFCVKNGIDYEVLYPDRDGTFEETAYKTKHFAWKPKQHKMINFLRFRRQIICYLKQEKPDFLIVLTTMPAVLLSGFLKRHYKGRYLVDIRDYTYENIKPYYLLEKIAIENAALRVISSPGFLKFLPQAEYNLCHNVNPAYRQGQGEKFQRRTDGKIIIGYVGTIAYKRQCMHLIKLVEKDPRFCFYLYGDEGGNDQIANYLEQNSCERVVAFGPYHPSEKADIISGVDILFNAYGNGNRLLDYALSNKLYDGFYMRRPLLTSPQTAMSEEAGMFSFDIDLENETSLDGLYEWYCHISAEEFDIKAAEYLSKVFCQQDAFCENLQKVLLSKNLSKKAGDL